MRRRWGGVIVGTVAVALLYGSITPAPRRVEVRGARGGLPAHVAASFTEPVGFQRLASGTSYVFDRRNHTVYRIAEDGGAAEKIVEVGYEPGRIIQHGAQWDVRGRRRAQQPRASPDLLALGHAAGRLPVARPGSRTRHGQRPR